MSGVTSAVTFGLSRLSPGGRRNPAVAELPASPMHKLGGASGNLCHVSGAKRSIGPVRSFVSRTSTRLSRLATSTQLPPFEFV